MAKMPRSKVSVVDNKTGEKVEYFSTTTPNKTTIGNTYFGDLNYEGVAKVNKRWPEVVDTKSYLALLQAMFKAHGCELDSSNLGNRAGSWNTPEAREAFSVFVNDQPYNPSMGKQAQKAVAPEIVLEQPAMMPEPALADAKPSVTAEDAIRFEKLIGFLNAGRTPAEIMPALTQTVGAEKAKTMMAAAQITLAPAPAPVAKPEFNFQL